MDDRGEDQHGAGVGELLEVVRAQRQQVDDQQRQIEQLRIELTGLRQRLDRLGDAAPVGPAPDPNGPGPDVERAVGRTDAAPVPSAGSVPDRRSFVRVGAAAGAAAAAGWLVAAQADPVAAATGDSLVLGHVDNVASGGTGLEVTGSHRPYGVAVTDNGLGTVPGEIEAAVLGHTDAGAFQQGVVGYATNVGIAVWGRNDVSGVGVRGDCAGGHGVEGRAFGPASIGVYGVADEYMGVRGDATTGYGVFGYASGSGTAVQGSSTSGIGGYFSGGTVAVVLGGGGGAPPQQAVAHSVGSLTVDGNGDLWYCAVAGTPGTWRRLAGAGTTGALSVLPASTRIYDSRAGLAPVGVAKGRFVDHEQRVIDATLGGAVPAGASAVLLNATATDTNPGGYFSFFANGVAWPGTSSLNWALPNSTVANLAVVPVDAAARFVARCEGPGGADLVIDCIGSFR